MTRVLYSKRSSLMPPGNVRMSGARCCRWLKVPVLADPATGKTSIIKRHHMYFHSPAQTSTGSSASTSQPRAAGPATELWVLRGTLTLKATDATLVSVEGNNGQLSASVLLLCAHPETITEAIPGASAVTCTSTVPRHPSDVPVGGLDLGRDRAQDPGPGIVGTFEPSSDGPHDAAFQVQQQARANCARAQSLYNSGVFYNSRAL
jgi:hypothetical protein